MTYIPARWIRAYSLDFTAQANLTIVNGANTIDGKTWTGVNVGNASSFSIVNGTGLVIAASATSTDYHNATRTSPILNIPISSLIPNYSIEGHIVRFMARVLLTNCDTNFEGARLGIEDSSAPTTQNFSLVKMFNGGDNFLVASTVSGSSVTGTQSNNFSDDVLAVTFEAPKGFELNSGVFSGGEFPYRPGTFRLGEIQNLATPILDRQTDPRVFMAHQTGNTTSAFTMTVTNFLAEFVRKQPHSR